MRETELRVVLYSHDSQGLGHTRRNLALARALARTLPATTGRRVSGMLLTGVDATAVPGLPEGFDRVVLPGIRKTGGGYAPRGLAVGMDRLTALRSGLLDAALTGFRPHLVVVDRHAWGVDRELLGPLLRLRAAHPGTAVVLGLREVLDEPAAAAREWAALGDLELVRRVYDQVWVYGDPAVHDPVATSEVPARLADLVRHTGYLATGREAGPRTSGTGRPYVLSMAGGGSDGAALTLAAARARVPHGHGHVVVAGPQMPAADLARVRAAARPGTTVLPSVPDALAEVREAAAVVSMGGYNSVAEVLATTTPALVVPRERPRREQLIRARALQARGAVDVLSPGALTTGAVEAWLHRAVGTVRTRHHLALDGLRTVPVLAAGLLAARGPAGPPAAPEAPAPSYAGGAR
ncbi:glycosyl transferase family 28 [Kocuria flava]|uniref:Glycosyl transferase n=1 Tax=Kocuria flava TaxID=446860 RepID=A0A0U3HCQ7_9MICC|nr:glycosyltransferase [Kocuria flava]ALU40725.1 glycosyl transferase family 28 [Kocuria flava]GEO92945.1 glycosyl transferase [Kocuria flava]